MDSTPKIERDTTGLKKQADGDQSVFIEGRFAKIQIDVETDADVAAGSTLQVFFVTPGMSRPKSLRGADGKPVIIDLTVPYPVSLEDLCLERLIFRPVGLEAARSYQVVVLSQEVV